MDTQDVNYYLVQELKTEGISNPYVLTAITSVKRNSFVPREYKDYAYNNTALPIGYEQTISQPYVVARMTDLLLGSEKKLNRVLEIGTGSGYQAAVLSLLAQEVYSIERIQPLSEAAKQLLKKLGYINVTVIFGDGNLGLPDKAPLDGIIVTAACSAIPENWLQQLADGGRLVLPLHQDNETYLYRITRSGDHFIKERFDPVRFVPLLPGIK